MMEYRTKLKIIHVDNNKDFLVLFNLNSGYIGKICVTSNVENKSAKFFIMLPAGKIKPFARTSN